MNDILAMLGRYEKAILEGETLARLVYERLHEDGFDSDYRPYTFLNEFNEAHNHLNNEDFIFYLKFIFCFLHHPLPRSLELLRHREESDAAIILDGFVLMFQKSFEPETMEEYEL